MKNVIIVGGSCRSGKHMLVKRLLLNGCADLNIVESIEDVKIINHHFKAEGAAINDLRNELLRFVDEQKRIKKQSFEKPQSKFISNPKNNYRKR
jgi:hypothetical protein